MTNCKPNYEVLNDCKNILEDAYNEISPQLKLISHTNTEGLIAFNPSVFS